MRFKIFKRGPSGNLESQDGVLNACFGKAELETAEIGNRGTSSSGAPLLRTNHGERVGFAQDL